MITLKEELQNCIKGSASTLLAYPEKTWITRNEAHFKSKPIFSLLKPVTSKSVQGRSQIDLVDLSKYPQEMGEKTY